MGGPRAESFGRKPFQGIFLRQRGLSAARAFNESMVRESGFAFRDFHSANLARPTVDIAEQEFADFPKVGQIEVVANRVESQPVGEDGDQGGLHPFQFRRIGDA